MPLNKPKDSIKEAVDLEEIDADLYRSKHLWRPHGARGVFGGQVVGQALVAATRTTMPGFHVHSLHAFFVRAGDSSRPILYHVRNIRDGTGFATRTVEAKQAGLVIFVCQVSFHKKLRAGGEGVAMIPTFQVDPPPAPPPESLPTREDNDERLKFFHGGSEPFDLDIRPIIDDDPLIEGKGNRMMVWMRALGPIGDSEGLHQCIAAYVTDHFLLSTALRPAGIKDPQEIGLMVSLDHCIWFHRPFRADQWMLYVMENSSSNDERSFCLGRLYNLQGRKTDRNFPNLPIGDLVLSCAQEGLIRLRHFDNSNSNKL